MTGEGLEGGGLRGWGRKIRWRVDSPFLSTVEKVVRVGKGETGEQRCSSFLRGPVYAVCDLYAVTCGL